MNKLNEYDSAKHPDNSQELEEAKYKYLFKDKKLPEEEQTKQEAEEIIDQIINLADKYVYNRYEPDKSIDILDEVCAKVSLKESKKLNKKRESTSLK